MADYGQQQAQAQPVITPVPTPPVPQQTYSQPPQPSFSGYSVQQPYAQPQPTPAQPMDILAAIPDEQKVRLLTAPCRSLIEHFSQAMIMHVIQMTPEQINALGPTERASVLQLVSPWSPLSIFTDFLCRERHCWVSLPHDHQFVPFCCTYNNYQPSFWRRLLQYTQRSYHEGSFTTDARLQPKSSVNP